MCYKLVTVMAVILMTSTGYAIEDKSSYTLVDGKFGKTIRIDKEAWQRVAVKPTKAFFERPITVEYWMNLKSSGYNNFIMSAGTPTTAGHWSIFVPRWGMGDLGCFVPDYQIDTHSAPTKLAPEKWYYTAVILQDDHIAMYMDGKEIYSAKLSKPNEAKLPDVLTDEFHLFFGTDTVYNSEALFDEVRISKGVRECSVIPTEPFKADANTIGLWHFDEESEGKFRDQSSKGNNAYLYSPPKISLNEVDRTVFHPGPSPFQSNCEQMTLTEAQNQKQDGPMEVPLDGIWEMAEAGSEQFRLTQDWPDSFDAKVPGSTHQALFEAGKIPDPRVGKNIEIACQKSFSPYYFKKTFVRPSGEGPFKIVFEGICDQYSVWLNGQLLGKHTGKYLRRQFDITSLLKEKNTLIVRVDAAERQWHYGEYVSSFATNDIDIPSTQGWHYAQLPVQGIWKSVKIKSVPSVQIINPFVVTEDTQKGIVHLLADLHVDQNDVSGEWIATIKPDNFEGKAYEFRKKIVAKSPKTSVHYRFEIPDVKLWWPVDYGKQNLYQLQLRFVPDNGGAVEYKDIVFGVRTVENKPLPGGPYPNRYNWQFVINGKDVFLKGANWCWTEAFLGFSKDRYERFIGLARDQHVNVLRAWGAGIYETKEFYEVCDRMGVMVYQELIGGPYDLWDKTVEQFIEDMRNHPSLIWYGGGNEIGFPYGHLNKIGRIVFELDGTRPFHRTEPWGGSEHDYGVFWGNSPFEHNLDVVGKTCFIGEFGFTSMPSIESVMKYMPEKEKNIWPYDPNGSYAYHTPAYNRNAGYGHDMSHIDHYAVDFCRMENMERHIIASQLAQTTALRPTAEQARCLWPRSVGICYYKLTNCVPAASYDVIDWYGVPKITHYFLADAYAPLHGCVIVDSYNPMGKEVKAQVYILDDANELNGSKWSVSVKAFDCNLGVVKEQSYAGSNSIEKVKQLGEFALSAEQTQSTPLLIVVQTHCNKKIIDHTFYWLNYKAKPGCLMELPATKLEVKVVSKGCEPDKGLPYAVMITNKGNKSAVGTHFNCPKISDTFRTRDNYFWLEPGESKTVAVSHVENVSVSAWNAEEVTWNSTGISLH